MSETVTTGEQAGEQATYPPTRCPFATQPEYDQLRDAGPMSKVTAFNGANEVWYATKHEDARAILADSRFSADRRREGFPQIAAGPNNQNNFRKQPPSMITVDGAEHSKKRRDVIGEFTVKRLAALQPRIQEIVDEFIDKMLAGEERPVDLVAALSLPVPSLVICEMLGVPYADHPFFQEHSSTLLRRSADPAKRQESVNQLRGYLDKLLTEKETNPGDDLLSRQIERQRAEGTLDHGELISLAFLLLVAGHETTANMISLGTIALLRNPEQLAQIKADPARTAIAVEELLRFLSIVDGVPRQALEDVEVGGVTIKAGEGVIASALSADWDRGVFPGADRLDLDRGARHHVAFGYGPHQCLGQNLARQELQIVFNTLFRRIPELRLAVPVEELSFKDDGIVYGVYQLPVTW